MLLNEFASQLPELGTLVSPTPFDGRVVLLNHGLMDELALPKQMHDPNWWCPALFTKSGTLSKGSMAQKYGGHQFGYWNPELGDGRGLLLGEWRTKNGYMDLHLKGAGKTPYSRFGDGRAVLRSTLREYLAGEAMAGLGIPTSRALCLLDSNEPVQREQLERAAMLVRTSESHLRFGHFEYFYHSNQHRQLNALFAFCFSHYFIKEGGDEQPHLALFARITRDTARLIAKWQAVGFNHGVMNTDNMSIHGITFDYGPYAFLDTFAPGHICNHSDYNGRYAFDQQPGVGLWNLQALAQAFTPYVEVDALQACLRAYEEELKQHYAALMCAKLGLDKPRRGDEQLLQGWLNLLEKQAKDYHQSFRLLAAFFTPGNPVATHFEQHPDYLSWAASYAARLANSRLSEAERQQQIRSHTPAVVLRNHLAQQAIEAAEAGDFGPAETLLAALKRPFSVLEQHRALCQPPPPGTLTRPISCSS